jgi:hypothetical protein
MRGYATVVPAFWTGGTGKAITAAGKDTRIVATYLLTCEHVNMLGLYRLPFLYAAKETGLKPREIAAALKQLQAIGFAHYDEVTEFVWVINLARFQLALLPGEALKDGDNRSKGAARVYRHIPSNPFLGPFHDRYSTVLSLPIRRDFLSETKALTSPLEGASEPLGRGYGPVPGPDSDRKGDTGETTITSGSTVVQPQANSSSSSSLDSYRESKGHHSIKELNGHGPSFEVFWATYPKKEGKGACRRWWKEHKPDDVLLGLMLAKIQQARQTQKWNEQGGKFIPMPLTWLNQERWDDQYTVAAKQKEPLPL